jgi:hypothetical protein
MNPMGKMEDRMKKGMKDLMGKKSPVKEIDPALDEFASMVNKDKKKAAGGMMKKKGYAKGGMMKKGYKKGGKIRGAGMASKGVRPAKMVAMKGS